MAKPCIVKYKGKEYSVEQFSAMLHDGLLNNLIESGAIDQNKLKGDLKLLQDKGISFRYTLQEDGVSVVLEGTEAINKGANAQTIRTGTRKSNNLKYIDNYSFDDVLNETYNTNSGAVSLAIKLGEGIFNYKKKNKTTGVVSKKSFVIPFLNIEAANKLKKLRKEYKKLNPPESKEEKARKAEDKRLLTQEQLKQKQAENRAKKAEERKLLSKEEKKAIADKNAKDKKRSAKIKEELNQITKQILVDFHKMMVLNLLAIYDTLDQNFVQLSKQWYLGANRFANAYANKYKLTVEQASAIIAVLSPQNDWFNNLSVAERVMEIMANYSNTKMTSDIIQKAIKNQTTGEEEKNFVDVLRVAFKKFGEVSIEDLRKMGATEEVQAIYLRAFDHAFHSNKVAITDPTGKFIGFDTTPVRWNSTSEITKAITVYRDSSMVTINDQLGGGSKVRNFYNNIVDPNSPTPYVTSDTHAAAAALSIPMSANDAGTGFKLFDSGLNPVYAMVKQAYKSAADIVGLFPREFQSITWEGTRLGINDKNRTEEKKNETFNEVSKLRENPKTNAYENARAIIAINPSGDPKWGESRGIKTQKSTFKDSESIRSDSNKRISQVSNYGQESGRLRGDSTRVGGETTRGQADTGEVSFRFEKSGTATVKNAPKGTYLNIGLLKGETEELISIDDVLSKLPSDVKVIKQRQVTGTEPTLALQISRKMSDQEMEDFRNATAQMAIPQLSDGKGVIHGTQEWGEFNPEFFVLPNNKQLSSLKGVEITSVEPNEEGPSFRKDDKVKGTYFEPAMTTDSKGNYVFFHFSTAPLKSLMKGIDSRRYYSTRTSREEKGLQYGVASYYTKPTDSENVVGGDKYYVTVSPDKVYPMDLDPNGYRAAAEKKFKKNTPFRESRISKEIANAAARDGYQMAVGEWSFDRAGLTQSETPEFRGDALVPLKPTELTGKEKFKTGKERGIKTEHPDKARLAFNQQVEDLASDIDSYKSSKGKFDDAYEIASTVMVYGGIVEDYGTKDERVRPLTREEFDKMTKGLSPKLKQRAEKLREQMDDMGISFRVDENYKNNIEKQLGKFDEQIKNKKFPSALEFAKYILPKEIFDRYRNLYELAARNNIKVNIEQEVFGSDGTTAIANHGWGKLNFGKYNSLNYVDNYEEFAEFLNHEIIHGLIYYGIKNDYALFTDLQNVMENVVNKWDSASEEVKFIISYIQDTRRTYKKPDIYNATEEEYDSDNFRMIGSLEELITYAFTNTEFAEFLDSIPASKDINVKGKSIFEQLKNIIRGFIKKLVKGPTALDEINSVLENYFDTSIQEEVIARANSEDNRGLKFNADEISFRADMGQRRIASNIRLVAMLKGSAFKGLRNAINTSADTFYTKQKYAQLKPQIANMSDAELIAAIDVETSLEDIINYVDGPIVGLAFIEYINRLKNIVEDPNSTQTDIDDANDLIQSTYERVAPFTTKVAQILRQLGEIKSTIKKDEVQFYLDMIEALIEANGNMINDDHRDALRDIIQLLLDSKKNHASLFSNLANKGGNVTDQDIHDLNMAEVEMQNATAALNMLVGFLSPPSTARFWAGVLKGNLMSVRSATVGLLSNILNIGVFRYRNLVQATLSIPFAILKKAGINTGLEKYQFFNTPIVSNIKYALFIDVLQDAIVGLTKAIVTAGKIMIGKETRRGFLDKSPIANQVFNIIKYGSSALEGGSPVMIDQSNHIMLSIKNAFTGKGQKTRLDIRGIKMDVANSFKKANFSKWFKANYPGSDYNALSAKDKKIIQNEYFNDPSTMVPTLGDKAGGLGRAFMAFNSEFVFRLVALSDYLPKTYANNVEMTRLAQTLGLDERQTILFMKDPARYIEIVNNLLSPESLKFWTDTVAEVTVTKDTGTGMASVAIVNAIKYYVPQKLLQEFPNLKDNKWFSAVNTAWQLLIDSVVPFVKIPMNFISLVSDFLLPSKPALKVIYFFGLALKNRGTDQADAYALSAIKNVSTAVVAVGIRALAVGLVSIPGMVVLAPGKDDDDEKRKMKSKFSRMSINIDALRRYFGGEDPSYKDGDKYEALTAYGLLGMVIYNYASINETADKDYYDKLNSAPRNINPEQLNLGTPFNMKNANSLELELKAFQSSQFFIDQSWFVGVNGVLEGLTGGETGRDRFFNSFTTTLLSYWWGFSSHAQQISDIYREATGKPVFDLALPANLQDYNNPDYPGDIGDRIWNNIFKKNELVHKYLMEAPDESEYVKFGMYGEPLTPVPGITKNNTEIIMSVAGPMRTARTNLTKEERLYMAVYDNKSKINIPGQTLSYTEPTLKKSEKITVFMTDTDGEKVAKTFNAAVKPSDYNKINKMAGDALRDLHTVLLSEQGLLDYEVRGKVISPEDIMSKNWGNTREVANVRNAIALTFSEGNKLLNTFLKPWQMFGDNVGEYIDKEIIATIQGVKSLVASKISEYKVLNPETGKMEMLVNYLVGHPELESKLYNLALESIKLYLKLADESIEQEEEYNKLTDNPEMTIEQEKARKEGNF